MTKARCPCYSGRPYTECCEPLHLGTPAQNAERLMRSRYSAYALKLKDYLLNTWHENTRPELTEQDLLDIKWLGLSILETQAIDDHCATVTFAAKFKIGNAKHQILHECSEFVFEHGRWFYVQARESKKK